MIFPNGTESKTTFWEDFSIADAFGIGAIKDTYKRAFSSWKDDYEYLTELVIVTNLKCWQHYHEGNFEVSEVYSNMYYETRDYALDNLKGEQFEYFYNMTD